VAGNVVKGHFPRRRLLQVVAANTFQYLFKGAARNWVRNAGNTAPALGSMTLLLMLGGMVGLTGFALHNLEQAQAAQASMLHVYMRDNAIGSDVDGLWNRLAADPRVASVTFTSKADALQRAQSIPRLPELAAASDSNPFPASLNVQVKSIAEVESIVVMVQNDPAVDPVAPTSYDRGAYQRIQAILFGLAVAGFVFLGVLGFVAITVTINSIRSAIYARRDEVSIMQLVGAPRWMVRGPFVVEGAITGGLAGGIGGLVTFGLAAAGLGAGSNAFAEFAPGITMTVAAAAAVIVFAIGLGLGSGSSMVSVRRHLES
jgi:cell division transport system permease protein